MKYDPCPTCGHYDIPAYVRAPSVTAVLRPENPLREEVMRRLCSDAEVAMWQQKNMTTARGLGYPRPPDRIRENVARGKLLGVYKL